MAKENLTFNMPAGQTAARELLVAYVNVGEKLSPDWAPLGVRVTDSSAEYDWSRESNKDILGKTRNTMKTPIVSESFDPGELEAGDKAQEHIWNLGVRLQDAAALANQDMLLVHGYAGAEGSVFAERYSASSIEPTGLGGEGGGTVGMPYTVTFGGDRTTGTATVAEGTVTFNEDEE